MPDIPRYSALARWLHWLIAALLAAIIPLGIWMVVFAPKDEAFKLRLYDLHQSLGFTVFLLVLLRLTRRLNRGAPPLPVGTPALIRRAAGINHAALYAMLLIQPVMGVLDTTAWGFPLKYWGFVTIPTPIGHDETIAPLLSTLHRLGALTLMVLIAAHLLGAAYHIFIRRDGLLRRML
ncbi:MAG: cytochrome b [Rhodospirillales bacterium]|nr:cytochrome b [Rhodospirillales bacterium]